MVEELVEKLGCNLVELKVGMKGYQKAVKLVELMVGK